MRPELLPAAEERLDLDLAQEKPRMRVAVQPVHQAVRSLQRRSETSTNVSSLSPIHTGCEHANSSANPLMLRACSVNEHSHSQHHDSRFRLLALAAIVVDVKLGPFSSGCV